MRGLLSLLPPPSLCLDSEENVQPGFGPPALTEPGPSGVPEAFVVGCIIAVAGPCSYKSAETDPSEFGLFGPVLQRDLHFLVALWGGSTPPLPDCGFPPGPCTVTNPGERRQDIRSRGHFCPLFRQLVCIFVPRDSGVLGDPLRSDRPRAQPNQERGLAGSLMRL